MASQVRFSASCKPTVSLLGGLIILGGVSGSGTSTK